MSAARVQGAAARSFAVGMLLALVASSCSRGPAAERDGAPDRICSLTLATDEILAELVDPARVVGVTRFVDQEGNSNAVGHYPPSVARIEKAELERVVALEPDLVLVAPYNDADFLELMHRADLPVLQIDDYVSFEGVMQTYLKVGRAVDELERARGIAARMSADLSRLESALVGVEQRPRVAYWVGGWTAGSESTVGEMIVRAGGVNVAEELGMRASAEIDSERLIAAEPDVLLLGGWSHTLEEALESLPPALHELDAVREGRVIHLPGRWASTLSSAVVDGAFHLARRLHPELAEALGAEDA